MKKVMSLLVAGTLLLNCQCFATTTFNDVTEDAWYYQYVQYVSDQGMMKGTGNGNFSPLAQMTRAMIVQTLFNKAQVNEPEGGYIEVTGTSGESVSTFDPNALGETFDDQIITLNPTDITIKEELQPELVEGISKMELKDVPVTEWYYDAIQWGSLNGIIIPDLEGNYRPVANATREEVVVMMYNYAKYAGVDVSVGENTNILSYNDAFDISDGNFSAFQWACGSGIMTGTPDGYLNPKNEINRAEASTLFTKYNKTINGTTTDSGTEGQPVEASEADLQIALEGNPTTGYIWEARNYDEKIIKIPAYEYIPLPVEEGTVGSGGMYLFTIKGLSAGETKLTLVYLRPFEGDSSIEKEFEYVMRIDAEGKVTLVNAQIIR